MSASMTQLQPLWSLKKTGIYRPDARGEMNLYVGIAMLIIGNFSKSAVSPRAIAWALGRAVYLSQT